MAEFGENLKRVREEKGITQQTLADYLYVTRQAVSRWEGGSRYPDLMTAKKMAQYLEVSLDDLLSDEDMKLYVEKNAILESPVAKRLQTVLMSLAFMCYLLNSYIYLSNYFIQDGISISSNNTVRCILLTIVLSYGIFVSLYDKLNPKVMALIFILYYGVATVSDVIFCIIGNSGLSPWMLVVDMLFASVYMLICIRFFLSKKYVAPISVYFVAVINGGLGIIGSLSNLTADIPNELLRDVVMLNTLGIIEKVIICVLLVVMANTLDKKRRLAAR